MFRRKSLGSFLRMSSSLFQDGLNPGVSDGFVDLMSDPKEISTDGDYQMVKEEIHIK